METPNSDKDSQEDAEMLDLADQPSFQDNLKDASMESRSVSSRVRKKIPPQWSRVINVDLDREEDIVAASISLDSQMPSQVAERPK